MKIIEPSVTLITETDPWKKIEYIGRVCYKSEDKIAEGTARKFVESAIARKHYAILEHFRMTFEITGIPSVPAPFVNWMGIAYSAKMFEDGMHHYLTLSMSHIMQYNYSEEIPDDPTELLHRMMYIAFMTKYGGLETVTAQKPGVCALNVVIPGTTEPVTMQVNLLDSAKDIPNYSKADNDLHNYYTVKFVCDRGVTHELVRHKASFAQESTRYCNYTKGKFGGEISCIKPADYDTWPDQRKDAFLNGLRNAEHFYNKMIASGATPQEARAVLPNALKAEIVMTMPVWQWKHFFNLRSKGTTGAPHPDMKIVATKAYEIFKEQEGIAE